MKVLSLVVAIILIVLFLGLLSLLIAKGVLKLIATIKKHQKAKKRINRKGE